MRLKTKLVLAITGLVFLVVFTLSWIFLGQLLRQRMTQAFTANDMVAHQIASATRRSLEPTFADDGSRPTIPRHCGPSWPPSCAVMATLTALMNSAISYSPTVFDVAIADSEGARC